MGTSAEREASERDTNPRVDVLEERLRATRDELATIARTAGDAIKAVDIHLGLGAPERVRQALKSPLAKIECACDEASLRILASLATVRIVLEGMHVWHPGPQEKADLYKERCEARREAFLELAAEKGIEDAEEKRRRSAWDGQPLDEEDAARFRAIEQDPRWRCPLGDGIEPAVPRLVDGKWVVED